MSQLQPSTFFKYNLKPKVGNRSAFHVQFGVRKPLMQGMLPSFSSVNVSAALLNMFFLRLHFSYKSLPTNSVPILSKIA